MWLTIASILATFTFSKAKDKDGNEIEIEGDFYDSGVVTSVFNVLLKVYQLNIDISIHM